jgi:hypothetical protein
MDQPVKREGKQKKDKQKKADRRMKETEEKKTHSFFLPSFKI